jgi:hypothetical protein
VSDLDNLQSITQGWVMVEFSSSVALSNTTDYHVCAKTSDASSVGLYRNATTSNWSHLLRTTSTGAPAADDVLHVIGDWPSDTQTTYTVTVTTNDSNSYGQLTGTNPQGVTVGKGGTLEYTTASSTTTNLKWKGILGVFSSGTFNVGYCTNRDYSGGCSTFIPSNSTATISPDSSGTNVDSGIVVYSGGKLNWYGSNSPSIVKDLLAADTANGATTLTTTQSTGWLSGDTIVISGTGTAANGAETTALTGNCSGTSCPATALTNANVTSHCNTAGNYSHCGITPTQADLGRLTRNVIFTGNDSTHQGYFLALSGSQVVFRYAAIKWMGSATSNKRGINVQSIACTTTPCFDMQYSSVYDFIVSSSVGILIGGSTNNNITISNNVFFNTSSSQISGAVSSATLPQTYDSNLFVGGPNSGAIAQVFNSYGIFNNNIIANSPDRGLNVSVCTNKCSFANNIIHSCVNNAMQLAVPSTGGTITNTTAWRCNTAFQLDSGMFIIDGLTTFGNITAGMYISGGYPNARFSGVVSSGDVWSPTPTALVADAGWANPIYFESPVFSLVGGSGNNARIVHTQDIQIGGGVNKIIFNNGLFSASTLILGQTSLNTGSRVSFQHLDQVDGDHLTYTRAGTITIDTTNYYTASPSERLTPNSNATATERLQSGEQCVNIANGTKVTPTVRVCLISSPAYNGLAPRLMRQVNHALYAGETIADTVMATGTTSTGTCVGTGGTGWQTLSAQTAANTGDDGVVCFYVDVTGTAGYAVIDDWSTD